eukprot:PhF_6_TR42115/c0_g1_i2/m.63599/K20295/COG8; conserved oligomeric Golgi complex subunit 8
MNSFLKEPQRLANEQQRIRNEMVDLALRHYPVFVSASTHRTKILTELEKCKRATDSIVLGVAGLQSYSDEFGTKAADWKSSRSNLGNLIAQQGRIQEILEAPQLLDTCFRNEMFHEAMLVLQHVRTFVDQHYTTVPLIARIAAETEEIVNANVNALVQKLSSPSLPIPLCISIVSLLKRLNVCTDRDLRYVFLSKRFNYIESSLQEARALATTPYAYLSKITSVLKMQLSEVVSQYQTCFPTTSDTHHRLTAYDSELDVPCADPLYEHVIKVVTFYQTTAETQLAMIQSGGELASLIDQCLSCCTALSKINLDLTSTFVPLYTSRVYSIFEGFLVNAEKTFVSTMKSYRFGASSSNNKSSNNNNNTQGGNSNEMSLLLFPPVAYCSNEFLSGCNEIRKCAVISQSFRCLQRAEGALNNIISYATEIHRLSAFDTAELDNFITFAKVVMEDFVPLICKSVDTLFETNYLEGRRKDIVQPLLKVLSSCMALEEGHHSNDNSQQPIASGNGVA